MFQSLRLKYSSLSRNQQVFTGVFLSLSFSFITFFGPSILLGKEHKKSGHNLMDVDRPEAIQHQMDKAIIQHIEESKKK